MRAATQRRFEIHLPDVEGGALDQDEEWCEVVIDGERRRLRFHDYGEIYSEPGLYEQLFYDELECSSPTTVRELLEANLTADGVDPGELRVLDVGAGNGMVGEQLAELGVGELVGVDIVEEAAEAVERDRPGLYDDYYVLDLTEPRAQDELAEHDFNCLTSVAALGFGDIPPEAFASAYELCAEGSWVAFCIKQEMIAGDGANGFADLMRAGLDDGSLLLHTMQRYRHRLSAAGDPIHYMAVIAEKQGPLPLAEVS